jgi:adenylylsulfate kinase
LVREKGIEASQGAVAKYYKGEFMEEKIQPTGVTVWFTGLPSSGKSTIADVLAEKLKERGGRVERLDGDVIRANLWKELGFSKEDRDENIKMAAYLAGIFTRHGIITITTFVSPYQELRDHARRTIGNFIEVFVKCPVEECIKRDPKGLYKKALAGEIPNFTGISDPYEEPTSPELLIESHKESVDESVARVLDIMEKMGYL